MTRICTDEIFGNDSRPHVTQSGHHLREAWSRLVCGRGPSVDAAVASVCIKHDLDLRSELIRLAGSLSQCSERNHGGRQCRKAFAESSGPEELLALHHYTQL